MDLTAAQQVAVEASSRRAKGLLKVNIPTPLLYCTGQDAYSYGGAVYYPHPMRPDPIGETTPDQSRWSVKIADSDGALFADWWANRANWAGVAVTWTVLYRPPGVAAHSQLYQVAWPLGEVQYDPESGWLSLALAGGGLDPRAGGLEGNVTDFPNAPDSRKPIILGNGRSITFSQGPRSPPPTPGADETPWSGKMMSVTELVDEIMTDWSSQVDSGSTPSAGS